MYEVSESFKEKIKTYGRILNLQIEFGNISIEKQNIQKFELSYNGNLFTSIMRMLTIEISKTDLDNIEEIEKAENAIIKFGVKISENEEYEYINYGEFKVYNVENKVEKNCLEFTLYDYLIETHVNYDLNLTFPLTISEFLQQICNRFGFTLITTEFVNSANVIEEDLYTDLGMTFRDVLDEIAQVTGGFIKIYNKNLYVRFPADTGEIIDENDLEKLHIGEYVGRYNSVVLGRSPQEDNIYYPNGITDENRISIRIDNNQIMDKNRELYIESIYNQVNDFEYYVFEANSYGFGFFEFGDIATLKDLNGNEYKTIFMNLIQTIEGGGFKEKIYTDKMEFSETKYSNATGIEKRLKNTEIIVNKQQGEIKLLNEEKKTLENEIQETNAQINIKTNEVKTEVSESVTTSIMTALNNGYLTAEQVNALVEGNENEIATIKQQLTQTITDSQMQIAITTALEGGISYLKNTLFTINEQGMWIATNQDEFNALYNNKGMYLYSYDQMIAKFDVNGATLNNLKVEGEIETENLRIMNVVDNNEKRTHIHWIGG